MNARPLLQLLRIANAPTVPAEVIAAAALQSTIMGAPFLHDRTQQASLLIACLGATLLYLAGMALNDAAGLDHDRRLAPHRPIPSGRVSHASALAIGATLFILGAIILTLANAAALAPLAAALALTILAYTALHHSHPIPSVVLMGTCRALLWFIGAAAVLPQNTNPLTTIHPALIIPAAAAFTYTLLLTANARAEHQPSKARHAPPALALAPILPWTLAFTMLLILNERTQPLPILLAAGWIGAAYIAATFANLAIFHHAIQQWILCMPAAAAVVALIAESTAAAIACFALAALTLALQRANLDTPAPPEHSATP